ncbi:MAG: hypothetical protein LBT83_00410, partial [Tannerella sp.]|nr:hypothetical protein [Tannerella sp.]
YSTFQVVVCMDDRLSPNRYASLGVIHIKTSGLFPHQHSLTSPPVIGRYEAIAHTTDVFSVSATASCLAVTAAVHTTGTYAGDRTNTTNKGACPLAARPLAARSTRTETRRPERPDFHNRRSLTCGEKTVPQQLPERQDVYGEVLPFRQQNTLSRDPQAALSLTCGYENYVPSGLKTGDRTASRSTDGARHVSTTAGTATDASRPNGDSKMIFLNHSNHSSDNIQITVRTDDPYRLYREGDLHAAGDHSLPD